MIKNFSLLILLLMFACSADEDLDISTNPTFSNLVICHSVGNGQFVKTFISETELAVHLDHGDGFPMECHKQSNLFMGVECNLYEVYHRNKCDN